MSCPVFSSRGAALVPTGTGVPVGFQCCCGHVEVIVRSGPSYPEISLKWLWLSDLEPEYQRKVTCVGGSLQENI